MLIIDQCYTCRACDGIISDHELTHHHSKRHPEIPLDTDIYEVLEINNDTDDAVDSENSSQNAESASTEHRLCMCGACFQHISDLELSHHHYKYHSEIPLDANIYQLVEIGDISNPITESESEDLSQYKPQFRCRACDRIVLQGDLDRHHAQCHPKIRSRVFLDNYPLNMPQRFYTRS